MPIKTSIMTSEHNYSSKVELTVWRWGGNGRMVGTNTLFVFQVVFDAASIFNCGG
ncbi:Uncharacterised protein [Sphingobacterium daejeonense]|nr:Uncharacterised protein [Sphingobacterium daejeonense]